MTTLTVETLLNIHENDRDQKDPSKEEKAELAFVTNLTQKQMKDWFGNERGRRKKAAGVTTALVENHSEEAVGTLKKWYEEHGSQGRVGVDYQAYQDSDHAFV